MQDRFPDVLANAFEAVSDAPNGIPKIRELILDLAVRGKLVPQSGEWRELTLEDIIADGPKNGWSPRTVEYQTEIRTLSLSATTSGRFDGTKFKYVDCDLGRVEKYWLCPNDILIQRANSMEYVGVSAVYLGDPRSFIYPDLMMRVRLKEKESVPFVWLSLSSPTSRDYMRERATGTSGSMPKINQKVVRSIPLFLPPIAEQKRIVTKVDALMALCDELEAKQSERQTVHLNLHKASLACLSADRRPADVEDSGACLLADREFADRWRHVADNFDTLITTPESVTTLRQTILDLAVRGKLVPQDPNDEPAISPTDRDDMPNGWAMVQYVGLTELVTSGSRGWKEYYSSTGALFIRAQNIKHDLLDLTDAAYVQLPGKVEGKRARVQQHDILVTITGANVTITALVSEPIGEAYISQHIALTRPKDPKMTPWLHLCFLTPASARGRLQQLAYGDKPGLNLANIRELPIPVPPIAEQKRIVAKVDALMALCNALEAKLRSAQTVSADLATATVSMSSGDDR
ncbi:MAG: restriction endonuclease subunit S [Lentisphaeria bacterium]|nr:restriction endonuclease subunit S [Lentisphaeria bacterium]